MNQALIRYSDSTAPFLVQRWSTVETGSWLSLPSRNTPVWPGHRIRI